MKLDTIIQKIATISTVDGKDHFEIIKELLELKSSLHDKEINSHLLHRLIGQYAIVERKLENAYKELSLKNTQIIETLKERDRAFSRLEIEEKRTKKFADLLKKMFGRYLSPEVMNSIIEDPSTLELGGEKKMVTLMMTDLRGFTALCERLTPEQVVRMLNGYCKYMMEIIDKYQGTVNEILGDSLLIIFGAPKEMPDRTQCAVACAIEMQNAMAQVNHHNHSNGLPELEMGIGLNETEVIVGNIGSDKRSKYAVVGSGVNLTSRIESYTVGGQILVSKSVQKKIGNLLQIDTEKDVYPKGAQIPLRIYEVVGISKPWDIFLDRELQIQFELSKPIEVECRIVIDKAVQDDIITGAVVQLSNNDSHINFSQEIDSFTDLQISLVNFNTKDLSLPFYGKITRISDEKRGTHIVRFTSVPLEIKNFFQSLCL